MVISRKQYEFRDRVFKIQNILSFHTVWAVNSPMAEIILNPEPKAPRVSRTPVPRSDHIILENLVPESCEFINTSMTLAYEDVRENIKLKYNDFQTPQ